MNKILLFAFWLLPFAALAQSETCPRVWRSGDTLFTDPAPSVQWLRNGEFIPNANLNWYVPPANEQASYRVEARDGLSQNFNYEVGGGYELAGYIFDEQRRPVQGASVRYGLYRATSDEQGRFALPIFNEKPVEEIPIVVTVDKTGYWRNASRQYISGFHTTETQIMLHTQHVTNRMDATQGGEMAYRGFTLQLPPNSVQTESGTPYHGTILLNVKGALPSEPDFGLRMPGGDYAAIDANGNDVMLYSYGYLSAEMSAENGEKLELRPEARATLRFSLPYTETHRPDSVPLWHFNEATAVWEQEGWSKLNGSIYEGQVSHFSSWNCDVPAERSKVRGRVVGCNNEPVKGGWVRVGQRRVVADSLGNYWTFVPSGITFDTWAAVDTLRNISIAPQQERTLDDLKGRNFDGAAYWNPQTRTLNINLWGDVPVDLWLSVDSGQSWTQEREFFNLEPAPGSVWLETACSDRLVVLQLPPQDDCRRLSEDEFDDAWHYTTWEEALASKGSVYKLDFNWGRFDSRSELLAYFPCAMLLLLTSNQLTEMPEYIPNLTNLQWLSLSYNRLTNLPESIGNLTNLQSLGLDHNRLTLIPESIGNLTNLQSLSLNRNRLATLPGSITNLTNLKSLYISDNQLTGLPDSMTKLTNLYFLRLEGNGLTDLPECLTNMTNLRSLNLGQNPLTELPERITNMPQLRYLYLDNTQLTSLPENIGTLYNLVRLDLSHNQLTELPESIAHWTGLASLDLSHNQLTDLTPSIANLSSSLQELNLSGNPIPVERRAAIRAMLRGVDIIWE